MCRCEAQTGRVETPPLGGFQWRFNGGRNSRRHWSIALKGKANGGWSRLWAVPVGGAMAGDGGSILARATGQLLRERLA